MTPTNNNPTHTIYTTYSNGTGQETKWGVLKVSKDNIDPSTFRFTQTTVTKQWDTLELAKRAANITACLATQGSLLDMNITPSMSPL